MYIKSDELCPQLLLVCPSLVFIAQVLCTHMSHSVQEIQSMTSAASVVLYWSSSLKQIPHISVSVSCNSVCVCCVSLSDGLPSLSVIVFRLFFLWKRNVVVSCLACVKAFFFVLLICHLCHIILVPEQSPAGDALFLMCLYFHKFCTDSECPQACFQF